MKLPHLFFAFLAVVLLTSCQWHTSRKTLTVFAAASLTESFTDIAKKFETTHPGVDVQLNFAGSQALRLQIEQGAQTDLFASANESHMQALVNAELVRQPTIFTQNRLAVVVPVDNPASVLSLADLARPGLKLILANSEVPVGRYARQMLNNLNRDPYLGPEYAGNVLRNVVSEEDNVKAVVTKVRLGEADAGIVYLSDVTAAIAPDLMTLVIPANFNIEADYPIAILAGTAVPKLAEQFIVFVQSESGQDILAHHGFHLNQALASEPDP